MSGARKSYTYRVVTNNGHGVCSRDFLRCADAKACASAIAQREPRGFGPYEIARVEHVGHAHRYSVRRRTRWVPWEAGVNIDVRQPDWLWP